MLFFQLVESLSRGLYKHIVLESIVFCDLDFHSEAVFVESFKSRYVMVERTAIAAN